MRNVTDLGTNKTGIAMAPKLSDEMIQGAQQSVPSSAGNGQALAQVRKEYAMEAPPVGTVPPPGSLKGMATTAIEAIKGHKPTLFIDKLGERLAFERTGTRLYDALLAKFDSHGSWEGGPLRQELAHFGNEEAQHFEVLRQALESLGADPTTVTPAADIAAVESMGLGQVLTDPRTNLAQGLHAILVAELADHDGWEMLINLAEGIGQTDLASRFRKALQEEDEHLSHVRRWLSIHAEKEAHHELQETAPA
jgi:rubrerythrin